MVHCLEEKKIKEGFFPIVQKIIFDEIQTVIAISISFSQKGNYGYCVTKQEACGNNVIRG